MYIFNVQHADRNSLEYIQWNAIFGGWGPVLTRVSQVIGTSVSEPHTSELNCDFRVKAAYVIIAS